MDYTAETIQLFFVLIVLGAAYVGVRIWTQRSGGQGSGRGGAAAGLGGASGGAGDAASDVELAEEVGAAARKKKKGADRTKGRFQLQGKDAEVAAKVLKRMLKKDPGFRGQGEE